MCNNCVTIVIPVYNGEKHIETAIKSALNQNYKNIELIVVDDGSTDKTSQIVQKYRDKIRYIHKNNGGVASALNVGIKEMKGDYFSWLSHDDYYYPDKIEKEICSIKNVDSDRFIYSNFDVMDVEANKKHHGDSLVKKYGRLCEESLFPVLFILINGCTTLIHKSLFDEVGLFDEALRTSQDYDMWFRMLRNVNPIYVEESLVCYRNHALQGSKTIDTFKNDCQVQQLKMINALEKDEIEDVFGGEYKFYTDMIHLSLSCGWDKCLKELYDKLIYTNPPELNTEEEKHIYIYGAGVNGKKLYIDCIEHGVVVDGYIDRNKDLWGTTINGVECTSIDDIPRDSEIWISIVDDKDVKTMLDNRKLQYRDLLSANSSLFQLLPLKHEVMKMVKESGLL